MPYAPSYGCCAAKAAKLHAGERNASSNALSPPLDAARQLQELNLSGAAELNLCGAAGCNAALSPQLAMPLV